MNSLKEWLKKTFPDNRRPVAERRVVPGLEASSVAGTNAKADPVKNISASGMYVVTEERWPQGELVPLKLLSHDLPDHHSDLQVVVQAKAERWGEDGMGLSFVEPAPEDLWLWKSSDESAPEDVVRELRTGKALTFLGRICPSATQELKLLFREGLSNVRVDCAVDIALLAEELLAQQPDFEKMHAPSPIVLRIIADGSWAEIDCARQLWAGLLANSCTLTGDAESNMALVDILSQLATIDSRLFTAACTRSTKFVSTDGSISASSFTCKAEDLIEITGAHDLLKIDRNLTQLADLGLLKERVKAKFFTHDDDATITPTTFGLELYALCHGHRGNPQDFFGAVSSGSPIHADD